MEDQNIKPELHHTLPSSWARERRGPLVAELRRQNVRRRRTPRTFLLVPIVVLVAAAGGAGAVSLLDDDPPAVYNVSTCYASAKPGSRGVEAQADVSIGVVESCRREWRAGRVGSSTTPPPLVACLSGDEPTVIPGSSKAACRRLGLDPLSETAAQRSADFDHRLTLALEGCVPVARARRIVREELDRVGRKTWRVVVRPGQSGVERTDCVDSYGTNEIDGQPTRIELDYPVPSVTDAEARRFIERDIQRGCRRKGDPIDEAFRAAECDLPPGKRKDPRAYVRAMRHELRKRGIKRQVRARSVAPGKQVTGWSGFGDDIVIETATRRELATGQLPTKKGPRCLQEGCRP